MGTHNHVVQATAMDIDLNDSEAYGKAREAQQSSDDTMPQAGQTTTELYDQIPSSKATLQGIKRVLWTTVKELCPVRCTRRYREDARLTPIYAAKLMFMTTCIIMTWIQCVRSSSTTNVCLHIRNEGEAYYSIGRKMKNKC